MARRRKTQAEFIQEAQAKHGDRYDYSRVCYVNSNVKVTVICPAHGKFEILPNNHLQGSGCRKCGIERQVKQVTLTKEEFIKKAQAKHGNEYDYSQIQYVNGRTKITIICSKHGLFKQEAYSHIVGRGCPKCGKETRIKTIFTFEYKGTYYESLKHTCQKLGKKYDVVLGRLNLGWTLEQALDDELHHSKSSFRVNGVIYNSIKDAICLLNTPVSDTTVRERLAKGMSPEEALFTPPKFGYNNGVIYVITNLVNGKQYVGLTTTSLAERWEKHLKQISRKNISLIHKAIAKYGKENFTIEVIDRANTLKDLCTKECEWIERLNTLTPDGYNATPGGELGGFPGKPTRLPEDSTLYPTVKAAAQALSQKMNISQVAAETRIRTGRINVKKPHSMINTPIHTYWNYLIYQAVNPKSKNYNGSTIYDRWRDFALFYEDMASTYQKGSRLIRLDRDKPYSKDNCRWVTKNKVGKEAIAYES